MLCLMSRQSWSTAVRLSGRWVMWLPGMDLESLFLSRIHHHGNHVTQYPNSNTDETRHLVHWSNTAQGRNKISAICSSDNCCIVCVILPHLPNFSEVLRYFQVFIQSGLWKNQPASHIPWQHCHLSEEVFATHFIPNPWWVIVFQMQDGFSWPKLRKG